MADDVDFADERIEKELASALAAVPGVRDCITCADRAALKLRGVRRG